METTTTPKSPSRLARAVLAGLRISIEVLFILVGCALMVAGEPLYSTPLAITAAAYFFAADMLTLKLGGARGSLASLAMFFAPILAINVWDVSPVVTASVGVGLGVEMVVWGAASLGALAMGASTKRRDRRAAGGDA